MPLFWVLDESAKDDQFHFSIFGPVDCDYVKHCEGVKTLQIERADNGNGYTIGEDAFPTIHDVCAHIKQKLLLHDKKPQE